MYSGSRILLVVLLLSNLLWSCSDEYSVLKNDFSLQSLPCGNEVLVSQGTTKGWNKTIFFSLDAAAERLDSVQVTRIDTLIKKHLQGYDLARYSIVNLVVLRRNSVLDQIKDCDNKTLYYLNSDQRYPLVQYLWNRNEKDKVMVSVFSDGKLISEVLFKNLNEVGDAPGSANTGKGIEVMVNKGGATNSVIIPIKTK